jgi:hypothetical protein
MEKANREPRLAPAGFRPQNPQRVGEGGGVRWQPQASWNEGGNYRGCKQQCTMSAENARLLDGMASSATAAPIHEPCAGRTECIVAHRGRGQSDRMQKGPRGDAIHIWRTAAVSMESTCSASRTARQPYGHREKRTRYQATHHGDPVNQAGKLAAKQELLVAVPGSFHRGVPRHDCRRSSAVPRPRQKLHW